MGDAKLLLRSEDRDRTLETPGDNPTGAFRWHLRTPLEGKYILRWLLVPNTLYTVNTQKNKLYTDLGTYTLPSRNYTSTQLAAALSALLAADDANLSVTFDTDQLKFAWTTADTAAGSYLEITDGANSINHLIGLPAGEQVLLAEVLQPYTTTFSNPSAGTGSTQYSPYVGNMSSPKSLTVDIDQADATGVVSGRRYASIGPSSSYRQVTSSHRASFIVPLLAGSGFFSFTSSDVTRQYITFSTRTWCLDVLVGNPDTNGPALMNGGEWELYLEKIPSIASI
jgi:hypothetical protein